jgi:hypothetical protein
MTTRVADIIEPSIWLPYMIEKTKEKSLLVQSGILEQTPQFDELATGGGHTVNMPFFSDLTGDDEVESDLTPLTPGKIQARQDMAVKHYRAKAWGTNDLAGSIAGTDPAEAIAGLVGEYWARRFQALLISTLRGVFASTLMASEHVRNLSIPAGNSATAINLISSNAAIDSFKLMGDELDAIAAIALHGDIYHELLKQDVIEFEQPSEQGIVIQRYKGRTLIVDDTLPKVPAATNGFVYSTYMFGLGAVGYGEGQPKTPVETDRDVLQGDEYFVNRRHMILHPRGVKWTGAAPVAGKSPTNTELQAAAGWQRVYEKKNVRLLELKTNG